MRLKNWTNIPDEKIREIISFVKPNGVANFDVQVKNTSGLFKGRAFISWNRILVKVSKDERAFPFYIDRTRYTTHFEKIQENGKEIYNEVITKKQHGGYLNMLLLSREEALVQVIAHELRHLWQKKHQGKRGKVWGARGKFSERDADAYGIRMVRKWRRRK